jgi:hypothetical protein
VETAAAAGTPQGSTRDHQNQQLVLTKGVVSVWTSSALLCGLAFLSISFKSFLGSAVEIGYPFINTDVFGDPGDYKEPIAWYVHDLAIYLAPVIMGVVRIIKPNFSAKIKIDLIHVWTVYFFVIFASQFLSYGSFPIRVWLDFAIVIMQVSYALYYTYYIEKIN